MGDTELLYLVSHHCLPTTQPYQAIMEGESGRDYATKYLTGKKFTDTHPTTVVEFLIPVRCSPLYLLLFFLFLGELVQQPEREAVQNRGWLLICRYVFQLLSRATFSAVGLGNKAGNGIDRFNQEMISGKCTYKIVKVKRNKK
jgi:hypothetical protein